MWEQNTIQRKQIKSNPDIIFPNNLNYSKNRKSLWNYFPFSIERESGLMPYFTCHKLSEKNVTDEIIVERIMMYQLSRHVH